MGSFVLIRALFHFVLCYMIRKRVVLDRKIQQFLAIYKSSISCLSKLCNVATINFAFELTTSIRLVQFRHDLETEYRIPF
jgi:hypothetical protein